MIDALLSVPLALIGAKEEGARGERRWKKKKTWR